MLASASPGLLREMIKGFAQPMMGGEVEALCGAAYGEVSPDRVNSPSLTGALRRFSLLPVPVPGRAGGGGVTEAVEQRPPQAVTPAPAESLPQAP